MENREFQLGIEYQLTKNSVVSARYVNKKLLNTIEDIGYLDAEGNEVYITGNPGKGIVACKPDSAFPCPTSRRPRPSATTRPSSSSSTAASPTTSRSARAYTYSELDGQLLRSRELRRVRPHRPERRALLRRLGLRLRLAARHRRRRPQHRPPARLRAAGRLPDALDDDRRPQLLLVLGRRRSRPTPPTTASTSSPTAATTWAVSPA